MATEITSKTELSGMATDLNTKKMTISEIFDEVKSTLEGVENYKDIDVKSAISILISNLTNSFYDLNVVGQNVGNYIGAITDFDVDDFTSSNIEAYLASIGGTAITLPDGLGSVHSYMGWQCVTARNSQQYKLRDSAGMNFDSEGFARIGDRYVVATTTTFGKVGDYIDVYQEDGTVIKCVIGDIKSQADAGCTEWGHNNGQCVVEFVVDQNSWYGSSMHANPGTAQCHPEWNQNIDKIINKGNYFDIANSTEIQNNSANWAAMVSAGTVSTAGVTASHQTYSHSSYNGNSQPIISTTGVQTSSGNPNIDLSKYHNNTAAGFEVTAGNQAYNLADEDIELLIAIVTAESDNSYDDALAVMTTILNRCETDNWINAHGTNPVSQATAPNQFVVYQHGTYKRFMNYNAPESVITAVRDALAGVRNHDYLSFRSNGSTGYSNNLISPTGNRYK